MDALNAKGELRRMNRKDLLALAWNQKLSGCPISGQACGFHLFYKSYHFCVSEIFGESCMIEKSAPHEAAFPLMERLNLLSCLTGNLEEFGPPYEKEKAEFKVYWRDPTTSTMTLLGKITERRKKERGNNLRDLLIRAIRDYSPFVQDPTTLFLLGS